MRSSGVRAVVGVVLAAAFVTGAVVGCDDELPAVGQCNALVDRICARMATCAVTTSAAECRAAVTPVLDCGNAVAVGASYSTCLGEVPAIDCAAFSGADWLPASCHGVILM
jgi:hypothetical protein